MSVLGDVEQLVSTLNTKGIISFPGFFDTQIVEALKAQGRELMDADEPYLKYFRDGPNCRIAAAPCNLDEHNAWDKLSASQKALESCGIDEIAKGFLGDGYGLAQMICDYSQPPHDGELFPLHFDNFDGQKCLKAFIYLTDCDKSNAAFRYVPYSQHIANAHVASVRKTTTTRRDDDNALSELLDTKDQHLKEFLAESPENRAMLEKLEFLASSPNDSYEYCVEGPAGTLVIFDTMGIHGGGKIESAERMVFRCHYVDSDYVFKHLSDQLPPLQAIASKVARRFRNAFAS
ncbi:phytanoyl-CoA dioxygenase family protein [Magnetovibrio sp. PR-2]|uniref:phytanoyl-CoA dioxygenase family protein n=1 Tax=Magnetovibrio sp. PR-2 TaxID=3120356 RepID=UPI002FCDF812